jgi:hypothetical protein
MAGGWFMDVVSDAPEVHSMIAASAPELSKSPVPQSVRALRWGPDQTKVVECAPDGEEALVRRWSVANSFNMIMLDQISGRGLRLRCVAGRRRCFRLFWSWKNGCLRSVKRVASIIDIAARHSVLSGSV